MMWYNFISMDNMVLHAELQLSSVIKMKKWKIHVIDITMLSRLLQKMLKLSIFTHIYVLYAAAVVLVLDLSNTFLSGSIVQEIYQICGKKLA